MQMFVSFTVNEFVSSIDVFEFVARNVILVFILPNKIVGNFFVII